MITLRILCGIMNPHADCVIVSIVSWGSRCHPQSAGRMGPIWIATSPTAKSPLNPWSLSLSLSHTHTHAYIYTDIQVSILWDPTSGVRLPKHGGVFYDLGSGCGKGVIAAHLLHNFQKCHGIELV